MKQRRLQKPSAADLVLQINEKEGGSAQEENSNGMKSKTMFNQSKNTVMAGENESGKGKVSEEGKLQKGLNRKITKKSCFSMPKSRFAEDPSLTLDTTDSAEEEEEETGGHSKDDHPCCETKTNFRGKTWMLVECFVLAVIVALTLCGVLVKKVKNRSVGGLAVWKWGIMILVTFSGRFLSSRFMELVVYLVESNSFLKKKVLYFVYKLKSSVRNCIWIGSVLTAWLLIVAREKEEMFALTNDRRYRILRLVTRALVSLLLAAFFWVLKNLALKLMISKFYVKTFFDRIRESIFQQKVLETLLSSGTAESKTNGDLLQAGCWGCGKSFVNNGKNNDDNTCPYTTHQLREMTRENISAWNMMELENFVRVSRLPSPNYSSKKDEIVDEESAKDVARQIFSGLALPETDNSILRKRDLKKFLSKEETDEVFPKIQQVSERDKITESALRDWLKKVYLERRTLTHALTDTKTAVRQLNQIISALLLVIIVIVILLVLGLATKENILLVSSQLVVAAFVFKNTCKTVFESIVFVFVLHPFDVGDRCVVDGVQMIVEEMNILNTTFLRYDNEKIFYPNSVLTSKPISNFQRSPPMQDIIEFNVDVSTPVEKIQALQQEIEAYLKLKPYSWNPKYTLVVKEIVDMNNMKMALYVTHRMNHQDIIAKIKRKSELVLQLKKICEGHNIKYHLLPQQVTVQMMTSTAS